MANNAGNNMAENTGGDDGRTGVHTGSFRRSHDRAAQFLPFAALTGYEQMVSEYTQQYAQQHEQQTAEQNVERTQHTPAHTNPQEHTHSLAGTSGAPLPANRIYLHVVAQTDEQGETRPLEVIWPDGRRFKVAASLLVRELGRWERGTRLIGWEVTFKQGRKEIRRTLWWERGRWFVAARTHNAKLHP